MRSKWLIALSLAVVAAYTLFVFFFPEKLEVKFAPVGGWDVDSGSYFDFTRKLAGEDGGGYFKEMRHRPVYSALAVVPYILTNSKLAMLVPVFLTAAALPYIIFLLFREYGISKETSLIAAVLILFSRVFAFYGAVAMADVPALFFGAVAMLFWKKKEKTNSAVLTSIAILTRESNLLFLFSQLVSDLKKGRIGQYQVLPIAVSLLLIGSYGEFFVRAHTQYSESVPEDAMDLSERVVAVKDTLISTFGLVTLLAVLGWTKNLEMNALFFGNTALQLAWQSVHKRFWLPAFIPLLFFAARWMDGLKRHEKIAVAIALLFLDPSYSVIPGAIAAIF